MWSMVNRSEIDALISARTSIDWQPDIMTSTAKVLDPGWQMLKMGRGRSEKIVPKVGHNSKGWYHHHSLINFWKNRSFHDGSKDIAMVLKSATSYNPQGINIKKSSQLLSWWKRMSIVCQTDRNCTLALCTDVWGPAPVLKKQTFLKHANRNLG